MSSPFRRRPIERGEDEPAALTRLVRCVEVAPMQSLDDFARPSTPGGGDRDPRVSSSHGDRALYDSQLQVCAARPSLCLQDCVRCASSMANPVVSRARAVQLANQLVTNSMGGAELSEMQRAEVCVHPARRGTLHCSPCYQISAREY